MANGDSSNPLQQYGYDNQTGQALAQSLGLTTAQLAAAFATTPATSVSQPQSGGQYGKASPGPTMGRDLDATVNQLQLMQAVGSLGGGNQSAQPPSSTPGGVSTDPMNAAVNLGAAALNMPAVYNPTPGQASAKSGVGKVVAPVSSTDVPTMPSQYANSSIGNVFTPTANNPAPTTGGTPTPVMPANATATTPMGRPATPYATAPPAPGIQIPSIPPAVHNDGLINAGQALYAHMTGNDPSTASHQDIANFHTQLANHIGGFLGNAGTPGANYTVGVNQSPNTMAPVPAKMAAGGMVPGRGNQDTVPALLTPGEYVIPKQQVAQMFGGRQPVRMQEGGLVTDDDSSDEPPETRRKRLQVASSVAQALQQTGSGNQPSSVPNQAPAAPGGYTGPSAQQLQAIYGGTPSSATPAGGWPSQTPSVAPSYDMPSDPDPDWQYTGQQSMAGPTGAGAGGPSAAAGAAGIAGGLASGLSAAAKTYADSIKSWQWQPQQFSSAPSAPSGPAAQFTQQQVDQKKKQQESPMMAAMYGYNPYQA